MDTIAKPFTRNPLDLEKLAGSGSPGAPGWVIENRLARGQIGLLSSRRGIGASLLAHQIGYAGWLGADFIATATAPQRVLIWDAEGNRNELEALQLALNRHYSKSYNIQHCAAAGGMFIEPMAELECALVDVVISKLMRTPTAKELYEQVGDYRADLAILNNIDRFFGGNQNDPHHRGALISVVKWALSPTGAAGLLVCQSIPQYRQQFDAASAWGELCHAHLHFTSKIPDISATKVPDNQDEGEPQTDWRYLLKRRVNWTSHDVCAMFADEGAYNIGAHKVVDPAMRFAHRKSVTIEGFKKLKLMNIDPTESTRSSDYLPRRIIEHSFHDGLTEKELAEMMHWLMVRGVFTIGFSQYENRTPRKILVLHEEAL